MVKKEYMKPALLLMETEVESSILVTSLKVVKTSGLDDNEELEYSEEGSDLELAW